MNKQEITLDNSTPTNFIPINTSHSAMFITWHLETISTNEYVDPEMMSDLTLLRISARVGDTDKYMDFDGNDYKLSEKYMVNWTSLLTNKIKLDVYALNVDHRLIVEIATK